MKRRQLFIVPVLVILFSFFSCEQDVNLTLPPHTPRLVIHGYAEAGKLFSIAVGKTFAANVLLPINDTYLKDAIVTLYENNTLREVLVYDTASRRYVTVSAVPHPGNTYRITVAAPGFEMAEAVATTPSLVPTSAVQYLRNTRTDERGNLLSDVLFRFNDPAGQTNHYLTEINRGNPYSASSAFCLYTYDPSVEKYQASLNPFEAGNCILSTQVLYMDRSFNGSSKQIVLSGQEESIREYTDPATGIIYRPYLKRYMVSEEYYRYIKNGIITGGIGGDPFSQPVSTYTNVKNGYGLFTIYSSVTDTLR
ncbi:MAG: DUF4249 domain-containing protein [Bacteroidetes bacterium]|nr:DUF4249 domain-containing protein [Bacteroidota bacterium]